jgi:hypothetical protein
VQRLACERPLTFPLTPRTGRLTDGYLLSMDMKYSHVLVMDVGSYPVQLTARASSSTKRPICPFKCSSDLDQAASCDYSGCTCGYSSSGALHVSFMWL